MWWGTVITDRAEIAARNINAGRSRASSKNAQSVTGVLGCQFGEKSPFHSKPPSVVGEGQMSEIACFQQSCPLLHNAGPMTLDELKPFLDKTVTLCMTNGEIAKVRVWSTK
jgi:hypothetical protein